MEFLRPKDVIRKMKISRPLLYNYIKKGVFPKPIKISPTISVWLNSEVEKIMQLMYKRADETTIKKIVEEIEQLRDKGYPTTDLSLSR